MHEDHEFEDLLQSDESFEQAFIWVERFQEFRNQRLETIPLDSLRTDDKPMPSVTINKEGPNSRIEYQVNVAHNTGKTQEIEATTESSKKSAEKLVKSDLTQETSYKCESSDMEQE